jgi:hypothetical protein
LSITLRQLGLLRGGSWINNNDNLRVSYRNNNNPDNHNNTYGFRLLALHISRNAGLLLLLGKEGIKKCTQCR